MTWQGENNDSCQVAVGVDVTGIDDSITGSRNFGGLTLGTLSRSFFSCCLASTLKSFNQHHERSTVYSSQQVTITVKLGQSICDLSLSIHPAEEYPWSSLVLSDNGQINSTPLVFAGTDCLVVEVIEITLRTRDPHERRHIFLFFYSRRLKPSTMTSHHLSPCRRPHFDHTGHVHSFLVLDTIFLTYFTCAPQRASTLS